MKILIAGYGSIGRRHMRNLLELGERDILLYRTKKSTLPEDELAGFLVETSLDAALSHRPDGVIIANPTAYHMDVAIAAAEAGCSLLMEKPIAANLDRIGELKAALKHGGGQVVVGFQFRFHPGLQQASLLLLDEAAGRPVSVRAHWGEYLPNWHPWEDYRQSYSARTDLGGGVVLTLTHPLDYLHWLLGPVSDLWAFTGNLGGLGISVEDTAEIGLKFASGLLGTVQLNYIQRPPVHRLEIVGSKGTILWDNSDGAVRLYRAASNSWEDFFVPDGFERNQMFLAEMRHFLAVSRGDAQPLCTLNDGEMALRMALAVHQSAAESRAIKI